MIDSALLRTVSGLRRLLERPAALRNQNSRTLAALGLQQPEHLPPLEFKHGELKTAGGRKVKNPKQAIAIGLREAGASACETKEKNRENLKHQVARELKRILRAK